MAETSFPFGSSSIATEDQWSSMFRMTQVDGVFATDPTGTDLRVTGANASTVAVAAGEAWVQGTYYANSASLNVAVPTNSGGSSARKDLVVLRRDPSSDVVSVQYRTGGASFPSLTQTLNGTWEIPLAQVTVAAGASVVAPSGVVDQRWFLGRPVALSNPSARPPVVKGQLIVEGKTLLLGNGVDYDIVATAGQDSGWKNISLTFGPAGYVVQNAAPAYRVKDGIVYLRGSFKHTNDTAFANDALIQFANVPAEATPIGATRYALAPTAFNDYTVGGTSIGMCHSRVEIRPDGTCWYIVPPPAYPTWIGLDSVTYSL